MKTTKKARPHGKYFMTEGGEQYSIRFSMKAEGNNAEIMVYSQIARRKSYGNRDDEVDQASTNKFDGAIKDAKKGGAKNLTIRVNSPGGEVWAAVSMRSMVINAGFDSVRVMIEGLCASAATLFATIPGARVIIAEGSSFMIHNPMALAFGTAADMEKEAEDLRKMEKQFRGMYAARTGRDEEKIKGWMDATTWFTAKEAVENGFCDELLDTGRKAVACVTGRDMALMKEIYGEVPEQISVEEPAIEKPRTGGGERADPGAADGNADGNAETGREEESQMDINNLTAEELRSGNEALYNQITQEAVRAERERIDAIDALTMPGYEDMAEEAKANGTSAVDFNRSLVAAMKKRGSDFLKSRQKETAPSAQVAGGQPDDGRTEEDEVKAFAKDVAGYANEFTPRGANGMF